MIEYVVHTVLFSDLSYIFYCFLATAFIGYFLLTGSVYLYFYIVMRDRWAKLKIQKEMPASSEVIREIQWSLASSFVWISYAILIVVGTDQGWFRLYFSVAQYGISYFLFSIMMLVALHDTYFYWAHRFMHSSFGVSRHFHLLHHQSHNPTPFAMHAFAPLEACAHATFIPLVLLIMPIHLYALAAWFSIEVTVNLLGHLGYELFPLAFFTGGVGKWINSPTHHNLHHQESRYGFGHYLNFWDRTMGTNQPDYDDILNKAS